MLIEVADEPLRGGLESCETQCTVSVQRKVC